MNPHTLITEADQAFASGQLEVGLAKLREYCAANLADAGTWNRLAVIEEQIGDWSAAGQAHYRCLELAPHIATSYIYAGYWLQKSKKLDAAAAAYSLAQDASPNSLLAQNGQSEQARLRANEANKHLRQYLSQQHCNLFVNEHDCANIRDSIWPRTHDRKFSYANKDFAPELFYIPALTHQAYHNLNNLDWAQDLLNHKSNVVAELNQALSKNKLLRPYLAENSISHGPLAELAGSQNWSALDLYKEGVANSAVTEIFQETLALINAIPTYNLEDTPFEVFFSVLKAGQSIAPHFGQSNHSLTVHLPIDIPQNCYLEVAGHKRNWLPNELLTFDDSFIHSAHNQSNNDRIVLIFSVWHPELSPQECAAIQRSFQARQEWMVARVTSLKSHFGG